LWRVFSGARISPGIIRNQTDKKSETGSRAKKTLFFLIRRSERVERTLAESEKMTRYVCLECHYIYDPLKGDPKNGIPPGTAWEDVPDSWRCPECKILKAKKDVFKSV
jgi:rubredoxin